MELHAPFPWFGGKATVSEVVWSRFGNVPNYVEPFFGSGAVLLGRPHDPKTETINDLDGLVANFWRAIERTSRLVPAPQCHWRGISQTLICPNRGINLENSLPLHFRRLVGQGVDRGWPRDHPRLRDHAPQTGDVRGLLWRAAPHP
jgi:hypothetical protein